MRFSALATCALLMLVPASPLLTQNTNYRAQGHYYSAKQKFESKNYEEALAYIGKSKAALGGSNPELQYLHVLSAFNLGRYEEAQRELETFFRITETDAGRVNFDKSVDRLTSDEIRALTMLINSVDEAADRERIAAAERNRDPDELYAEGLAAYNRRDFAAAVKPLTGAAEKRHAEAQVLLGNMYDSGAGVTMNEREAMRWYRLAAEQGHVESMGRLGTMFLGYQVGAPFRDERGVERVNLESDLPEALRWLRRAAEQGDYLGLMGLARLYWEGEIVSRNPAETERLLRLAAKQDPNGKRYPSAVWALTCIVDRRWRNDPNMCL